MTLQEFAPVFALLAKQLQFRDADEADIRAYFEALKDLPFPLVQFAAVRMARDGGVTVRKTDESPFWFPKAPEWRAVVQQIQRERTDQQRALMRASPKPWCAVCEDTGWARDEATNRVSTCDCRRLRRLEIEGVRPFPELPEAS